MLHHRALPDWMPTGEWQGCLAECRLVCPFALHHLSFRIRRLRQVALPRRYPRGIPWFTLKEYVIFPKPGCPKQCTRGFALGWCDTICCITTSHRHAAILKLS